MICYNVASCFSVQHYIGSILTANAIILVFQMKHKFMFFPLFSRFLFDFLLCFALFPAAVFSVVRGVLTVLAPLIHCMFAVTICTFMTFPSTFETASLEFLFLCHDIVTSLNHSFATLFSFLKISESGLEFSKSYLRFPLCYHSCEGFQQAFQNHRYQ